MLLAGLLMTAAAVGTLAITDTDAAACTGVVAGADAISVTTAEAKMLAGAGAGVTTTRAAAGCTSFFAIGFIGCGGTTMRCF